MAFKTAEQLKIDVKLYTALISVLDILETEEIKHTSVWEAPPAHGGFNMSSVLDAKWNSREEKYECGTTGCICGWAAIKMSGIKSTVEGYFVTRDTINLADDILSEADAGLDQLFRAYWDSRDGRVVELSLNSITPKQSAKALRNYLTFGSPHWSRIATKTQHNNAGRYSS